MSLFIFVCTHKPSAGLSCLYQERIDGIRRRIILEDSIGIAESILGQQGEDPSEKALFVGFSRSLLQDSIADEHLARRSLDRAGANGAEQPSLPHVAHPGQRITIFEPDYFILVLICWIHAASFLAQILRRSC